MIRQPGEDGHLVLPAGQAAASADRQACGAPASGGKWYWDPHGLGHRVFRFDGLLPMAGVRVEDVHHVLWAEAAFGRLYDHE